MGRGPVKPRWVRDAADEALVVHGLGQKTALRYSVTVPAGWPISDGEGGTRPAWEGEKRHLGEFVSERCLGLWIASDRVKRLREIAKTEHVERLRIRTRQLVDTTVDSLRPIIEGKQPRLNKYGEPRRDADGRLMHEAVSATVRIQAGNLAVKLAELAEGPPAQRVEMEHSGGMKITASTPEEIEELRKATIERIAARHAAQSSG